MVKTRSWQVAFSGALLLCSLFTYGQTTPARAPTAQQLQAAINNPVLPPAIATNPAYQPRRDWGCEVLMCLSNPNGATAVNACVPPMQRLWRHLSRGGKFPTCTMSNGQDSRTAGTWVQPTQNYYNLCPAGTRPLAANSHALVRAPNAAQPVVYAGIGDGSNLYPNDDSRMGYNTSGLPPMVCVGNLLSTTQQWVVARGARSDEMQQITVGNYDAVVIQEPVNSPGAFDVYINHQVHLRARY